MKKLVLIILLLFSSSNLLTTMGSADTTSYDTKGQVGFTGNWVGQNQVQVVKRILKKTFQLLRPYSQKQEIWNSHQW